MRQFQKKGLNTASGRSVLFEGGGSHPGARRRTRPEIMDKIPTAPGPPKKQRLSKRVAAVSSESKSEPDDSVADSIQEATLCVYVHPYP